MQQKIIIGAVVVIIIAGMAFWVLSSKNHRADDSMQPVLEFMEEGREMVDELQAEGVGAKAWIDAITLGKKLKCTYAQDDESGGRVETVMFVDGKRYRTEFSGGGMRYVSVFDGETMYTWTEGQEQGFMMNLQCMEEFGEMYSEEGAGEEQTYYESSEEAIESIPDISCNEIDSVDVSVPSDVTFVDQCEMIKEQTEQLQDLQDQMPEEVRAMLE